MLQQQQQQQQQQQKGWLRNQQRQRLHIAQQHPRKPAHQEIPTCNK
jgi:hypothetical protein